jgi:hypothetical protein
MYALPVSVSPHGVQEPQRWGVKKEKKIHTFITGKSIPQSLWGECLNPAGNKEIQYLVCTVQTYMYIL